MKRPTILSLSLTLTTGFFSYSLSAASSRRVFINGVDVSSMIGQKMKDVDVTIDEKGNIYIVAPQYQVKEEDAFVPLSRLKKEELKKDLPKQDPVPPIAHKEPGPAPIPVSEPAL